MQALPAQPESLCIVEMGGTEKQDELGERGSIGFLYLNIGLQVRNPEALLTFMTPLFNVGIFCTYGFSYPPYETWTVLLCVPLISSLIRTKQVYKKVFL